MANILKFASKGTKSFKAVGNRIAFLDEKANLFLVRGARTTKTEKIDDHVSDYQLLAEALVFQTSEGALFKLQL